MLTFYRNIFSCCLCLFFAAGAQAQALDTSRELTQFMKDSWTTDQGLPHNSIMSQVKSRKGYFWLATFDGLVRFDGVKAETFNQQNTPAFGTNSILSVFEDQRGTLWIGTNGRGVIQYSADTFSVPAFNDLLPNTTITSFAEGLDGSLLIGTRQGLAFIKDNGFISLPEELSTANIFCIQSSREGVVWIGTLGRGLWQYRLKDGSFKQFTIRDGLSSNSIRSVLPARDGKVWIGTEEGLFSLNGEGKIIPVKPVHRVFINDLTQDQAGTIWAGTDGGLFRYQDDRLDILKIGEGEKSDAVQHVYHDREGSLWIGTYHHGLIRLRDGKFRNYSQPEGLPNQVVNVVYPDSGQFWIGTDAGLALLTKKGAMQQVKIEESPSSNRIRDILRVKNGNLFIATYGGLFLREKEGFRKIKLKNFSETDRRIRRIIEDGEGNLWVGTNSGLYQLKGKGKNQSPELIALENMYIMALHSDKEGTLWIGTNGAGVFTYRNGELEQFEQSSKIASDVIFNIFEDRQGSLWFLTNNGLSRLKENQLLSMNEQSGLFANTLFQMFQDSLNNYWFTSNRGIFQVAESSFLSLVENRELLSPGEFRHFTKADGLISSEITPSSKSALTKEGHFWFATLKGVSMVNPFRISRNQKPPKVILEKVLVDQKSVSSAKKASYPAGSRYFEFHYTGLNYQAPSASHFRYRLKNFEEVWHEAGTRRVAYYTNLPAGNYTFQVRAANEDGVWSEEEASFSFTKEAFFYEQLWFKVLVVVLFFFFCGLVYFVRVRGLKDHNSQLSSLVEQRTAHILAQRDSIEKQKDELSRLNNLKDRLLSIISHDLKGPLTSTMGILNLFNQKQISEDEIRLLSGDLSQYVGEQVNMLDNLLSWSRSQMNGFTINLTQVNLHQLIEETRVLYRKEAETKSISVENFVKPDIYVLADVNLLQLVVRNLLVNALKFTNSGGLITIKNFIKEDSCQIEVADNGIGMTKEQLADVFRSCRLTSMRGTFNEKGTGLGLAICKEFVGKWGGKIWAESYLGKGSCFKFTVSLYSQKPVLVEVKQQL